MMRSDLHIHTNLSFCAPSSTQPDSYLPYCEEEGISVMGFSNHVYSPHSLKNRQLAEKREPTMFYGYAPRLEELQGISSVRLLLGCEAEVVYEQEPSLSYEEARQFDYVLLAPSHIMNLPEEYRNFDLSTPDKIREMMLRQFFRACLLDYPVPTGICHPLYPVGSPWEQEIVDGITDSQLTDCFTAAAQKGLSIEIHACLYRNGTKRDKDGLSPSYLRILSAAKACGCQFHFGSDAHEPGAFRGVHCLLRLAAQRVGITDADLWQL